MTKISTINIALYASLVSLGISMNTSASWMKNCWSSLKRAKFTCLTSVASAALFTSKRQDDEETRSLHEAAFITIKAMEAKKQEDLKKITTRSSPGEEGESDKFTAFLQRHPYLPVLFPSGRGAVNYLGSNLDFSLGRDQLIIIQPDLQKSYVIERDNSSNNLTNAQLSGEAHNLFLELTKNAPGYNKISEHDITKEIYEINPVTPDIMSMTSEIPNPQFCTNTFVHKDAVKPLQEKFPEIIECTYDRCTVGNKKPFIGLGTLDKALEPNKYNEGNNLPQNGKWFKWWRSKK